MPFGPNMIVLKVWPFGSLSFARSETTNKSSGFFVREQQGRG